MEGGCVWCSSSNNDKLHNDGSWINVSVDVKKGGTSMQMFSLPMLKTTLKKIGGVTCAGLLAGWLLAGGCTHTSYPAVMCNF